MNDRQERVGEPTLKHWEWAIESIVSYCHWRMDGKLSKLKLPEGPTERAPEDPTEYDHDKPDYDHLNWIEIGQQLAIFASGHKDLAMIDGLVLHVHGHGRDVKEFMVPVPFLSLPRSLESLGPSAVASAQAALKNFERQVVWFKAQQDADRKALKIGQEEVA